MNLKFTIWCTVVVWLLGVTEFGVRSQMVCNRNMWSWVYQGHMCDIREKTDMLEEYMDELREEVLKLAKSLKSGGPKVSADCRGEYMPYKTGVFEYKICDKCVGWFRARKICQQDGGDLLTIGSDEEFDFFFNLQLKEKKKCTEQNSPWLGARDVKEGQWRWINGKPLSKTDKHWHNGQPDNYRKNEDCLHIWQRNGVTKLNDAPCKNWKLQFICRRKR